MSTPAAVPRASSALPAHAEAVLAVVESIPVGRVLSYGDIAEMVGSGGPRQVGQVMSRYGAAVPWWRVCRTDGTPPSCHEHRALEHLRSDGVTMRAGRVDMDLARWDGHPL